MERLLHWITYLNIENSILSIMAEHGYDAVIDFLMAEGFDHRESCMIFEHYSL